MTATLFDGRENKAELDDIIQIYFSKEQAERVFEVADVNNIALSPVVVAKSEHKEEEEKEVEEQDRKKDGDAYAQGCSSCYPEQSENRDGLQEPVQKDVRPIDSQELDTRKLKNKSLRSNFSDSSSSESRRQQSSSAVAVPALQLLLQLDLLL